MPLKERQHLRSRSGKRSLGYFQSLVSHFHDPHQSGVDPIDFADDLSNSISPADVSSLSKIPRISWLCSRSLRAELTSGRLEALAAKAG